MERIILIYGGKSAEHDISILSSYSMVNHLIKCYEEIQLVMIAKDGTWVKGPLITEAVSKKENLILSYSGQENEEGFLGNVIIPGDIYDEEAIIFPLLHGPNGEDGTIQGLFEVLNMPYVGTGVLASSCAMDKWMTKMIISQTNIPQLPYVGFTKKQWIDNNEQLLNHILKTLKFPIYIKPANMGSSVGISKACNEEELKNGIQEALKYDFRIVVEQGVVAREIEVAVLGNSDINTTVPGEVVKTVDFYDFDAKYVNNDVTLQIPAKISMDLQDKVREYAQVAYEALNCTGLSRCDFFLTEDNQLYLNEINTMPGFTPYSLYPLLWQEMGVSYEDLLVTLIDLAKNRHQEKNKLH